MAIGYAITYQYFTSVNYLCLPLGLNTAGTLFLWTPSRGSHISNQLGIYLPISARARRSNRFRHGKCLTVAELGFLKCHAYY